MPALTAYFLTFEYFEAYFRTKISEVGQVKRLLRMPSRGRIQDFLKGGSNLQRGVYFVGFTQLFK